MSYTLLTGATGLIGRYLLRDYAARGIPVAVLVRESESGSPSDRINAIADAMEQLPSSYRGSVNIPRPVCIVSDLHEPDLGMSESDAAWVRNNVSSVVHCAGNVTFHDPSQDTGPWNTNVNGTRHLASFCKANQIEDFSYVSTSFVCGDRVGLIREDELDCHQGFGSPYESSKFHAEKLLQGMDFERLNVFRPCAVTGDTVSGFSSTFHGVYWFAQFTHLARQRADAEDGQPWYSPIRIFKTGLERHHLVPVDMVSQAIVELQLDFDRPGDTYHLTPCKAMTLAELEAALSEHFRYYGTTFVGPKCDPNQPLSDMEQIFYEGLNAMGHRYLDGDPMFDCRKTLDALPWWSTVETSHSYILKIFEFAEGQRFGRGSRRRAKAVV